MSIFLIGYLLSIVYCLWRAYASYKRTSLDGVIGPTPGLDMIVFILFAPVLALVDIVLTWYRLMQENHQAGKGRPPLP